MTALITIFKTLPVEAEPLVLELTSRIEKLRALDDDESRLVEEAIRREKRRGWQDKGSSRRKYSRDDDNLILLKGNTLRGMAEIANRLGVSYNAIKVRRRRLRKKTRCNSTQESVG